MFGTTSRFWKKSREHVWLGIAFDLNQNFVKKLSQNFALNQNYWDMDSILHYLYLKKKKTKVVLSHFFIRNTSNSTHFVMVIYENNFWHTIQSPKLFTTVSMFRRPETPLWSPSPSKDPKIQLVWGSSLTQIWISILS
jgi:hypothetical protein